jgi:hypothetical protein
MLEVPTAKPLKGSTLGLVGAAVQISEKVFETHGVEALATMHISSSGAGEAADTELA